MYFPGVVRFLFRASWTQGRATTESEQCVGGEYQMLQYAAVHANHLPWTYRSRSVVCMRCSWAEPFSTDAVADCIQLNLHSLWSTLSPQHVATQS